MKTSYLMLMLTAVVVSGCSSVGKMKSATSPSPAMAFQTDSNPIRSRIISEFGEGEAKFLEMAPESAAD